MSLRILSTTTLALALLAGAANATATNDFTAVVASYDAARQALVDDSLDGVAEQGRAIARQVGKLAAKPTAVRAGVTADKLVEVTALLPEVEKAAAALAAAADLAAARDALYALSKPLVRWRQAAGEGPAVAYCSMAKRSWLQPAGEEVGNPYYGQQMPRCGEIVTPGN